MRSLTSLLVLIALFTYGCGSSSSSNPPGPPTPPPTNDQLWAATVTPYLSADLWTQNEAYDAGHYLMIPQIAAFRAGANASWQTEIRAMYQRWEAAGYPVADPGGNTHLTQLQFLYLAAVWDRLDANAPASLHPFLKGRIASLWSTEPAWHWSQPDFAGFKPRFEWKLTAGPQPKSYYTAITDEEMFLLATAAELRSTERQRGLPDDATLIDIAAMTKRVCDRYFVPSGDGVLPQPGLWTDHPDYAYAGNASIVPNMQPKPVPRISEDTSHDHRLPAFLASFRNGDPDNASFYAALLSELEAQFLNHVVLQPDASHSYLRTSNFMDGHDGVYRWRYATTGNSGYDASQLSGTATVGWWSITGTSRIQAYYHSLAAQFPLSNHALTTYVGPNTTRVRNPLVADPASYQNGFRLLLCKLAGNE